jgi:tetrahydroxynaphthalene reductase
MWWVGVVGLPQRTPPGAPRARPDNSAPCHNELPRTSHKPKIQADHHVSGRGIGREMALELGRRGAKVIVNYANSSESAEEVVNAIKKSGSDAVAIKANVSDVDQIVKLFEEAVKAFGKLNIVCSNSGVVSFGHVKDVTPEEFDRVFTINTRGQFFVAREAYKHLEVGGRLILMGSITGQAKGVPKHAVYSGSKGAIETFVRCMAVGK